MDRILISLRRFAYIFLALSVLGSFLFASGSTVPASAQEGEPEGEETQGPEVEILDVNLGVPNLLEPADDSFPQFTPTFRWSEVADIDNYLLEYTSDPTCNFGAGNTAQRETDYTSYTPTLPFPNDVNYCWRVRTEVGAAVSPWSSTRTFIKRWYFQPQLLTPVKGYQYARDVLLSWTPVPGASFYRVEINSVNSFPPPLVKQSIWVKCTTNTFYNFRTEAFGGVFYWRVIPIETNSASSKFICSTQGNEGQPSETSSFRGVHPNSGDYPSPQLFYPLYYYEPDESMQPREDRSVGVPVFQWHRTLAGDDQHEVAAYRLQVDDSPTFTSLNWTVDTENLSASPTSDNPFNGLGDSVYYWRVCALDALNGSCLPDPVNGLPMWSQVWAARFDQDLRLSPTSGSAPSLLRPESAYEAVEAFPQLEWWPHSGASKYEIQISVDPSFGTNQIVDQATVPYPTYTPFTKLDYSPADPVSNLPYGTYFWRVRSLNSQNDPTSDWSAAWRFQIAAQSHWVKSRNEGNLANRWQVAADPDDVGNAGDELLDLNVAQDFDDWYFGFHASAPTGDQVYGMYLDLDHEAGSGATFDPESHNIGAVSHHRPEYAVYLFASATPPNYTAGDAWVYTWDAAGNDWKIPQSLLSMGGGLMVDGDYIELRIPNFGIGMQETTGSLSVSLFSLNESTKQAVDTVPGGNASTLNRFASVSERQMLVSPPTDETGDPTTYSSVLPFFWHWPPVTQWGGYRIEIALDPLFTTSIYTIEVNPTFPYTCYLATPFIAPTYDLNGDNTYYWRIRAQSCLDGVNVGGAWSQPMRFERKGFTTKDLLVSFDEETPTFSWQRLEGVEAYELEVDDDPEFGSPVIKTKTSQVIYNPVNALEPGVYHLRVRPTRHNTNQPFNPIKGDWASTTLIVEGPDAVYLPLVMKP